MRNRKKSINLSEYLRLIFQVKLRVTSCTWPNFHKVYPISKFMELKFTPRKQLHIYFSKKKNPHMYMSTLGL